MVEPASYQKVVDHFQGRLQFLQCGEEGHWHPKLNGVINLIGKTDTRQFVRLMHHADGVVCPVTFAMHLAAAVETRPNHARPRPCVLIAGGREPAHWEAYSHHQYISTTGSLSCCQEGGCWKSRCQLVGDGDQKDQHDVCEQPVQLTPELRIPKCLDMIKADDVIRRIEMYCEADGSIHQNGAPTVTNRTISAAFLVSTGSREVGEDTLIGWRQRFIPPTSRTLRRCIPITAPCLNWFGVGSPSELSRSVFERVIRP
jgi:hypothetical protein